MKITPAQLLEFLRARYYFQDSQTFLKEILKQYPQFRYDGPAYRSVILGVDEKFIKKTEKFVYASFAKTLSGIHAFLMNYHAEGAIDVNRVVIVDALIEGLDLSLVINHLEDEGFVLDEVIHQLRKEEEVIALQVEELQKFPNDLFWHSQVMGELESLRDFLGYLLDKGIIGGRDWQGAIQQLRGINFLNHLLGINDNSVAQADLFLSSIKSKDSPLLIGQKLHELGFVIPEPYRDLIS